MKGAGDLTVSKLGPWTSRGRSRRDGRLGDDDDPRGQRRPQHHGAKHGNPLRHPRDVDNAGTTNWSRALQHVSRRSDFRQRAVTPFNNLAGGNLNITTDAQFDPDLNNAGTITVNAGAGTTTIGSATFNSSGAVVVDSGTLQILNNGTDSGPITIAAGSNLQFSSTNSTVGYTLAPGASIGGDGSVEIDDGANVVVDASIVVQTLSLTTGEISGTGNVTVADAFDWTGGEMAGSGATTIPVGAVLNITGPSTKVLSGTHAIDNAGTTNWSGAGTINGGPAVSGTVTPFNNLAGGNLNITADTYFYPDLNNAGTITVNAGAGTTTIGSSTFNTSGAVAIDSGALQILNDGTDSGPITIATGSVLQFSSTNVTIGYTLAPGASIVGDGAVAIVGEFANVVVETSITVETLAMSTGEISGTGNVTVTNTTFDWTGGEMAGSGTTTIPAGAVLNVTGPNNEILLGTHAINNSGATNWSGTGTFLGGPTFGGAVTPFNNLAGGNLNITADAQFDPNLNNAGTITVNAGAGTTTIGSAVFNSTGTLNVDSGTVQILNDGTDSGPIAIAAGSSLQFSSTNSTIGYTLAPGASIVGNGTVGIVGEFADLIVDANVTLNTLNMQTGEISGTGNLTVTSGFSTGRAGSWPTMATSPSPTPSTGRAALWTEPGR